MSKQEKRARFLKAMNMMFSAFDKECSEARLESYWDALADIDIDDIEKGARRAMREEEFLPAPARVRKLSGKSEGVQDLALEAWGRLVKAISLVGSYGSVDLGPATNAVVRELGGWSRLCAQDAEEFATFTRKAFLQTFESVAARGHSPEAGRHLAGSHERTCLSMGREPPAVRFLGGPGDAEQPRMLAESTSSAREAQERIRRVLAGIG